MSAQDGVSRLQDPAEPEAQESFLTEDGCYVALTHAPLNVQSIMDRVRSPQAGAIVLFAGTTRDSFADKSVSKLVYSAYVPRALRTMLDIATEIRAKHNLKSIAMIHRLGEVPVGEESIMIAVSAPHRGPAWRAGEEALEACKAKVEVWKWEEFAEEGGGGGAWRANRDGAVGERVA